MDDLSAAPIALTSLGLGLMMGLERERRGGANAGLRTFALVAISGTVTALLTERAAVHWLLPAIALGLVLMMVVADFQRPGADGGPDTTTTVAVLLCFLFGAMLWFGHLQLTVTLALAVTALLYFRTELHDATQRLTRQDIVSFLQFATISFVVLPILPDEGYGPYGQLNPYRLWLMVVLTAGISLAGYVALRIASNARVVPLLGLLGGLISSTATTLLYSRHARRDSRLEPAAAAIILIANLVLLVRIATLALVIAPGILRTLGPVLALGLTAGIAVPLRDWLRLARAEAPPSEIGNPTDLRNALAFAVIYGMVLIGTAAFHAHSGAVGVYGVAAISGIADMDAIAISTLQMLGPLTPMQASRAIVIALFANMGFKCAVVYVLGGRALVRRVAPSYCATTTGLGLGVLLAS